MKDFKVGVNDDYAALWNDELDFYYGYEYSVKKGKLKSGSFGDRKWAFVFQNKGDTVFFASTKDLEKFSPDVKHGEPVRYLLTGIAMLFSEGIVKNNDSLERNWA